MVNDEAEKEIISDENLDTECFPEENLQYFVEVDAVLWTNKEPNEKETNCSILNANEDETTR